MDKNRDDRKDAALATKASKATIISSIFSGLTLIVAILSLLIMYTDLSPTLDDIYGEVRRKLVLAAGVRDKYDTESPYENEVSATHGSELSVQIYFRNTSGSKMDEVAMRVVLPDALEFVPGSTVLYNQANPDGLMLQDGITDRWMNVGGYSPYDEKEQGSGTITFTVRVSEDKDSFQLGTNILNITCQIASYLDGALVTDMDTYTSYVAITVVSE